MNVAVIHAPSPEGREALRRAAHEAVTTSGMLLILHLLSGSADERAEAAERTAIARTVKAELATPDGQVPAHKLLLAPPGADTGATLVDLVASSKADLLVIGSRRRSPVGKLILGHHLNRLLLDVEIPILLVKSTTIVAPQQKDT